MSKHILIVGGGVVGLCSAYYCADRGHRVTVVERGPADHDGCSFGNAGFIVPSHIVPLSAPGMIVKGLKWMMNSTSPFYVKPRLDWDLLNWGWKFFRAANASHLKRSAPLLANLNLASRARYEELARLCGNDFGLVKRGILLLCRTDHGLDEEAKTAALAEQLGVRASVLSAAQTAALEPNIRMNIVGAVHYPQDCHLSPASFMTSLKRLLDQKGVRFIWSSEVVDWNVNGRRIVAARTTEQELAADEYLICAGAWSPVAVRRLGIRLPVQAGKGYSLTLPNPPRLPGISAILMEARVAVTPVRGSLRFGGTMEIAGLDETISAQRVQAIIDSACRYLPDFSPDDFRGVKPWCGLRPCSPDGLPYIGRFRRFTNLSTATGHTMMGLSLGPITGKLMSEVLSDEIPSIDIERLAPDRYS